MTNEENPVVDAPGWTALRGAIAPVSLMAVIFALSAQSDLDSGLGIWDLLGRKLGHMATFGLLTWLWLRALRDRVSDPLAWAAAISFLYAISDEYHQHFVEGRHGSPVDVLIDSIGIAAVVLYERRRATASRAQSP